MKREPTDAHPCGSCLRWPECNGVEWPSCCQKKTENGKERNHELRGSTAGDPGKRDPAGRR